ncbi:MAG: hypothetical protein FIA95_03500 [Gemmatimonadetes bacterium]|nr:hypothetical protein [Gemmatimonadota bacterium]
MPHGIPAAPSASRRPVHRGARPLPGVLLAAACLGAAACGGTARNPFAAPGTAETQLLVQVENQGFNDLRLYAISSRGNQSLGSVQGNTIRRLSLEWRQMEQLSFRLEVLAGRSYTTHAVSVSPGDRVYLVIPNDPAQAYIRLR